ncbi:hypothetical protein QW131_20240 [Roseibium salinum]|nr:hypothetical protein [Roseibium salinum]
MRAAGVVVVSAKCADILRQFDLGKSSLYPIRLFQYDRKTSVEGEYFSLNVGERKDAFLPSETLNLDVFDSGKMRMAPNLHDDDIALGPTALEGPDLWVNPPLINMFFLSDRLTQALRAAKMSRVFGFRKMPDYRKKRLMS